MEEGNWEGGEGGMKGINGYSIWAMYGIVLGYRRESCDDERKKRTAVTEWYGLIGSALYFVQRTSNAMG